MCGVQSSTGSGVEVWVRNQDKRWVYLALCLFYGIPDTGESVVESYACEMFDYGTCKPCIQVGSLNFVNIFFLDKSKKIHKAFQKSSQNYYVLFIPLPK